MNKNKKQKNIIIFTFLIFIIIFLTIIVFKKKETNIEINIGYQSITAQTWGALIIKNQHLFEKKLNETYSDKKFIVKWHDELSGSAINNNMLVHKYQLGYMGDMPCVINLYNSYINNNYDSYLIALDGKGVNGTNQAILVNQNSNFSSIRQLVGKKISVPIGSSAHRMLLKLLNDHGIMDSITILHQDIPTAIGMLETGKVDAIAVWEPYKTNLVTTGKAKVLSEGSETNHDYLAGIMIDKEFVDKYPDLVVKYIECVNEAHEFINTNPDDSALIISKENGFDTKVVKKVIKNILWNSELTQNDKNTLLKDYLFLKSINSVKEYPFIEELEKKEKLK